MKNWTRQLAHFRNTKFLITLLGALVFVFVSIIFNYYAGQYVVERASGPVTDIILSNIPVFNLDDLFVYGSGVFVFCIIAVCLWKIEKAPYVINSIALFVIIRALFMSMTHIGPFPTQIAIDPTSFLRDFTFGADLFFSGHTGLPFLLALIFWDIRWVRYVFIFFSVAFAVIVLLAHLHYSIDVFAAFFMTYSIFHICRHFFSPRAHLEMPQL